MIKIMRERLKKIYKGLLQYYKDISIKNKLKVLFYIQIIIPIIFIGYMAYNKTSQSINNKSFAYSQDILRMIELRVEDMNRDIDALTLQLLYDNRVYSFLQAKETNNANKYTEANYVRNLLRDAIFSRTSIEGICIVTNDKDFIYFDSDRGKKSIKERIPYDNIYSQALSNNGNTIWMFNKSEEKGMDLYAARVVYDKDTFNPLGLMALLINKNFIESLYKDLSQGSAQNISILSNTNEEIIVGDGNSGYSSALENIKFNSSKGYYLDSDNKVLISYLTMVKPNWRIVYHIPFDELYEEINSLKTQIFLIVIWSIVVLSLLSTLTAKDIIKPMNELVGAMKEIESSDIYREVNIDRTDEIGYLSKSFNKMSSKIHYLLNIIYKEKLTRKEAELKALQAQINPHFLFNTLENINWMAHLNGVPEISSTVTALSKLIEANMGKGDKLISIADEIDYIDNYIAILKNRFGDRLVMEKNISSETLVVMIPRLLIQPVVENAVQHGLENVVRQGIIVLNSYKKEEDLIIEVIDNGIGMKETELIKLKEMISGEGGNESSSIGLSNVSKRIKLFYGEDYGVEVESQYDKFTKVTLRLPFKSLGKDGEYYV
ncbi:sensor histidine kinase [Clostridium thermarum]|uniref:sensor histidine kinase n=1 Tax=Clostridium thermarum TaxID=1716543 RepID=UPI0013D88C0B|nr:sensor histidine kinase [Clostridium thermarum]